MRVLFVCTANICRSPLAAALLVHEANERAISDVKAASAGFLEGGRPVHEHVSAILDARGIDSSRKRSQRLTEEIVSPADLVLTMTSEHARGVVGRFPDSISDVYTMRHFASIVTPRPSGVDTGEWLDQINADNKRAYLGDDVTRDIPDPIGHPADVFEVLAAELTTSISWIMDCAYFTQALEEDVTPL